MYDYTRDETITTAPNQTTNFTYANSGWKDLLVAVNGVELTYDEIGNVLTFGDKEYTWNSGRNLESIVDGENTYSYTYDENGIRTSKTVNGVTTYYNTKNGVILSQSDGTNTMYFQYDTNGVPIGFIYNGIQYFYITNLNGDVVGITDSNGEVLSHYAYDEWGKLLSITTAEEGNEEQQKIAELNPLRYRGYYYDNETGMYYLQSRYYNPEICRFISADSFEYICQNGFLGLNIYLYCDNNSITYYDFSGFVKTKKYGELKNGWKYRIDSENSGTGTKRHIKVWKDGESYQQNDDGSPHDGSSGKPSRKIREELKNDGIWDWDAKEKEYNDNHKESSIDFGDLATVIVYSFIIAIAIATGVFVVIVIFNALPTPVKIFA